MVLLLPLCGIVGFMGLKMAVDAWRAGTVSQRILSVILGLIGLAFSAATLVAVWALLGRPGA